MESSFESSVQKSIVGLNYTGSSSTSKKAF